MKKEIGLNKIIDFILFLYTISLYLFTYREGLNNISNALAFILVILIWINFFANKRKLLFNNFLGLFLLFLIICAFSILYAINQNVSASMVVTLSLIFIVMVSLINYIDNFEKVKRILMYFMFSGFIASIYILVTSDLSQVTRIGSTLGNVNAMGMIIGLSATFCLYFVIYEKKHLFLIMLIIMIPTILLTGSRKSLLFVLFNFTLILYSKNSYNLKSIFKFFLFFSLVVIITYYLLFKIEYFYNIIGKRIENMLDLIIHDGTKDSSISTRINMIKFGIEMFKSKHIFGYGINNYRILYGNYINTEGTYSHNNLIELLVGVGLFGTIIYYLANFVVIKKLFFVPKKYKKISIIFIVIIVSYFFLGITSLIYYYDKHFSFLLVIASSINNCVKKEEIQNKVKSDIDGQKKDKIVVQS